MEGAGPGTRKAARKMYALLSSSRSSVYGITLPIFSSNNNKITKLHQAIDETANVCMPAARPRYKLQYKSLQALPSDPNHLHTRPELRQLSPLQPKRVVGRLVLPAKRLLRSVGHAFTSAGDGIGRALRYAAEGVAKSFCQAGGCVADLQGKSAFNMERGSEVGRWFTVLPRLPTVSPAWCGALVDCIAGG